jgi:NAD-dependent SIR2 family protein deacetylase
VDGHFQKAGFPAEHVTEVHGSIHYMQCVRDCGISIFPADGVRVEVDEKTFRACEPLPACPACGGLARPNILMFNDGGWDTARSREQGQRLQQWLRETTAGSLVVIELGAGTAVPTVRFFSEQMLLLRKAGMLIRINPREAQVSDRQIAVPLGALDGLRAIQAALATAGWDGDQR